MKIKTTEIKLGDSIRHRGTGGVYVRVLGIGADEEGIHLDTDLGCFVFGFKDRVDRSLTHNTTTKG